MPSTPTLTTGAGPPPANVGMLSTYPPRLCGLATFAAALERALTDAGERIRVVAVDDGERSARLPSAADRHLVNGSHDSLVAAADVLSRCDVVIVQHEYGVYGGADGEDVVELLERLTVPAIVVLHTVPAAPTAHQRVVLEQVAAAASAVVVMTDAAFARLLDGYAIDATKVRVIPHGALSPLRQVTPIDAKGERPTQLLTWGLLGPGKGIENVITALSLLDDLLPRVRYTVAGATHPNVFAREGDRYRASLIDLARTSGVAAGVRFDDTYRDVAELGRLVRSASAVVLPYESRDQVTSGVLVDAIAAGRPVIATAFPHAVELLSDGAGIVVPHDDPRALAAAIRTVVTEPAALASMSARAAQLAPTLLWSTVGEQYRALCNLVRAEQRELQHASRIAAS
jgi:glycosyltransferase involved in cell wall biosynthesis